MLIKDAKQGLITENIKKIALAEKIDEHALLQKIVRGTVVIPSNEKRKCKPIAIGEGLKTKINANIGTSVDLCDIELEKKKLKVAIEAGTDTIMDLSSDQVSSSMKKLIALCPVPFGTVPIYEVIVGSQTEHGNMVSASIDDFFKVIVKQAELGVDFMTIHSGINRQTLESLVNSERLMDIVSRGGALTVAWMLHNEKENPFYEHFDRLLEIIRQYDITISLGDGMRPGSIIDANDKPQFHELSVLGDLVLRCREAEVQVMVEGPGHVPLNKIEENVVLQKKACHGAPFYVLGPLVTDIAPGYDHITSAIGGAIAGSAGADFLCYVTPSEHLSLPSLEDVKEGVIASKIAAHAADIVKGVPGSRERDLEMSKARKSLDWDKQISLSIDPQKAKRYLNKKPKDEVACTMCGPYCAMKLVSEYLGKKVTRC